MEQRKTTGNIEESKNCGRCEKRKPILDFYTKGLGRREATCKECSKSKKKELFKRSKRRDQLIHSKTQELDLWDVPVLIVDSPLPTSAEVALITVKDMERIGKEVAVKRLKKVRDIWRLLIENEI